MVVAERFALSLAAFSTPCLCSLGYATVCGEMAPVAGLAPARTRLKDEALGSLHSRAKEILPPGLAPGLRPHLGLNGYKPFVLLYTTGGRKMAERGGHAPHAPVAHDFLSKESRFACPVHVPLVPTARTRGAEAPPPNAERKLRSGRCRNRTRTVRGLKSVPLLWATRALRRGAPGRSRTDTGRGLSPLPLLWATGANAWRGSAL